MPFLYWRDPLFCTCFAIYGLHCLTRMCGMHTAWCDAYLNDVLCIPFWVPLMLWTEKKLGLRREAGPPTRWEIIIPLLVWAALFEVVIPSRHEWGVALIADPYDILAYAFGAMVAAAFWRWYYALDVQEAVKYDSLC